MSPNLYFYIAGFVICIALSGFFSSSEMSFSSANQLRLEKQAAEGDRRAKTAVKILSRYDNALSAILIGNNLVNIAASSLASVIAIALARAAGLADNAYSLAATVVVTVLVIIFGETIPKIAAKKNANRLSLTLARPVRALSIVLTPVIFVVVGLVHLICRPMKGESTEDEQEAAVEELQSIIETVEDEGIIDEDRSELLQAALDFSDISASEVMTARVDMVALDIEDSWEDILETIDQAPYSRLPVYEGSVDNIIGVLYLNHFFKALVDREKVDIRSLLMEPCYVYKTVKLPAVLSRLRQAKMHLSIVTDEYGGTLGVVTMEDVLEQIVGEIWDETDEVEPEIVEKADGTYDLDGDMSISDFLELIGWDEDSFESDSATLGGWIIEQSGGFPAKGDSICCNGLRLTVLEMEDGLRVARVLVQKEAEATDPHKS